MLRIWLLGSFRVQAGTYPVPLNGKLRNLLALLLLQPRLPQPRERLANLLAPDAPPGRVMNNFSDTLYRLRQKLGSEWLDVTNEHITVREEACLWVDVWEFDKLSSEDSPEAQRQAVALYGGDLLPEVYQDWVLVDRVAVREKYLGVLGQLGRTAEHQDQLEQALAYYRRLVHDDALNEQAYRGLMRAYTRLNRHAEALEQYNNLVNVLAEELDTPPCPETRALAASIQAESRSRQTRPAEFPSGRPDEPALAGPHREKPPVQAGQLPSAGEQSPVAGPGRAVLWGSEFPPGSARIVELARADAALGKSLSAAERVRVAWTVHAGAEDDELLQRAGKLALRLHRIRRLIEEARAQGGVPTDADLARALGMSERTIENDMALLRAQGYAVFTRRRK